MEDKKLISILAKGGVLDYLERMEKLKAREVVFRYLESMFQADPVVHVMQQIALIFKGILEGAIEAWAHKELESSELEGFVKAEIERHKEKLRDRAAKIKYMLEKEKYDQYLISLAEEFIELAESIDMDRSIAEIVEMLEEPEKLLAKYEAAYAKHFDEKF
jgi:hypothetical protein